MKATISKDGRLTILPETDIEEFALASWNARYQTQGNNRTVLAIGTQEKTRELLGDKP